MLSANVIGVFILASVALALAPGPDNMFVLTQSAMSGRAAGLFVTLGLCTGIVAHTAAVTLGVAALLQASAVAFTGLKIIGATYLVVLAWLAFRAGPVEESAANASATRPGAMYLRGVIMNVTNPKVAIFFLAFLPQFTDPERGSVTLQLVTLGILFMTVTLLVFGSIAWAAGFVAEGARRETCRGESLTRHAP
jgi:threonine/homoserine/homoserine lactone efflux protein